MWGQNLLELFGRGGPVMYPLLLCSVVGAAVALERLVAFVLMRTRYRSLLKALERPVREGDLETARKVVDGFGGVLAPVTRTYLQHAERPAAAREEFVARSASEQVVRLERFLNWLGTIGHLAPMLGLLGTVTGLISAFHQVELLAGQVQPSDLARGIWEALLTTVFGLVIALPLLAIYHLLEHRAGRAALEMQWMVAYLDEWRGVSSNTRTQPDSADEVEQAEEPLEISTG